MGQIQSIHKKESDEFLNGLLKRLECQDSKHKLWREHTPNISPLLEKKINKKRDKIPLLRQIID